MFEIWGRAIYRRRVLALVIALIALAGAAAWGTGVFGSLQSSGGFAPPGSESQRASNLAASAFGRNDADVVVLYRSPAMTVADPAYRAAVTRSLAALPHGRVTAAQTTGPPVRPGSSARAGTRPMRCCSWPGPATTPRITSYDAIKRRSDRAPAAHPGRRQIPTESRSTTRSRPTSAGPRRISMPVLLILLLVIFGSLAAALPAAGHRGIAIIGSFAALRLLTLGTAVSIYSINITTILGLGLAIDYGLFMVGRFREELRPAADGRGRGGPDRRHRGPDRRGVRHHRRGGAGQPAAVPRGVPALDGLRRRRHRAGGHARRADRSARPARACSGTGSTRCGSAAWRRRGRRRTSHGGWHRHRRAASCAGRCLRVAIVVALLVLGAPFLHSAGAAPTPGRCRPARSRGRSPRR